MRIHLPVLGCQSGVWLQPLDTQVLHYYLTDSNTSDNGLTTTVPGVRFCMLLGQKTPVPVSENPGISSSACDAEYAGAGSWALTIRNSGVDMSYPSHATSCHFACMQ